MTVTLRSAGLVLIAALVTGCASPAQEPRMDPQATLAARSTSVAAVTRYEQMQNEIRHQLDAALGPFPWENSHTGTQSPCPGDLSHTDGIVVYLDPWTFDGHIADADWPRAEQIVTSIITRYGFTTPTLQIDQPGHHETSATDPALGAYYTFGGRVDTSMQVYTGCHRPT